MDPTTPSVPDTAGTRKTTVFKAFTPEQPVDSMQLLEYDVPLWGENAKTGDELQVWPFVAGGIGLPALAALLLLNRRRRNN